ncbi:MAG: class I adenylate-forming enzyme family protein [Candidatus Zixiibacteriota bacterium]
MSKPSVSIRSIYDFLESMSASDSARRALISPSQSLSYGELSGAVSTACGRLAALGVRPGDRVILAAPNSDDWIVVAHACTRFGAVVCPVDPGLTPGELRRRIELLGPTLIIGSAQVVEACADHPEILRRCLDRGIGSAGDLSWDRVESANWKSGQPDPGRLCAILMTSGSAGEPKGVALTGRNLVSGAEHQLRHFSGHGAQRWLVNLPLHHVGGFIVLFRALVGWGTIVVQERFNADEAIKAITQHGVTHLSLVATTLRRLLNADTLQQAAGRLQAALVGGGPCPLGLLAQAQAAGVPVCPTYGMTEACSQIATWRPGDPPELLGRAAPVIDGIELEIRDEAGHPVENGTDGEIWIKGPMIAEHYWEGPDRLIPAQQHGWLRTSDIGVMEPNRYLRVLGRSDDAIISGGEKIHPLEIESALLEIPGIARAVVLGEDDPNWGQSLVAVIQATEPIKEGEILSLLRARLAKFKIPKRVEFLDDWPEGAIGKVRRRDLRLLILGK